MIWWEVIRYLQGTSDYGVLYPKHDGQRGKLIVFCDSDSCGDRVQIRSTMGYMS